MTAAEAVEVLPMDTDHSRAVTLANEFAEVTVDVVHTRAGMRLRIRAPRSGREILLCPLELEALTWQDHELFSRLLSTPHGPESDA